VDGDIQAFLTDMSAAFAEADIVVSRAGAGAVSEIAAAGKPAIFIPLPTAADQHQLRNAEAMEQEGAARLVLDAEWTGERFVAEVAELLAEPKRLEKMAAAARTFAKPGAARRAADVLESFIRVGSTAV
jgi:UDP-N-acetylglucosamine--N-acetylmuramyl-(pentapeptide) pyrophosphoryl-undecaprenol N-acetylglucosamine transferase